MQRKTAMWTSFTAGVAAVGLAIAGPVEVDPALPDYTPIVSGTLTSIGSDTLNNLMTHWAEGFKALYPSVEFEIEGKGSTMAPLALIEGTAQLGPMSRPMKPHEIDRFEKQYGYKPTEIKVAIDTLAVFVNKDNPVKGLTLEQVDSIFSTTFTRGGKDVSKWGHVGLAGGWANKPISLYGRNSACGTYGFFKEVALKKGDFKSTVKQQPGSSAIVQGIASDRDGIGYGSIGYATEGVRALPLAGEDGKLHEPTLENSLNRKYPLARFLYVYVNKKPGEPLDPLVGEFIKYINSWQGQAIVVNDGYVPLPAALANQNLDLISERRVAGPIESDSRHKVGALPSADALPIRSSTSSSSSQQPGDSPLAQPEALIRLKVSDVELPAKWVDEPQEVIIEELTDDQLPVVMPALERAMSKYPEGFLARNIDAILVCQRVQSRGREKTGLCLGRLIVVVYKGQALDSFETTFHHEVAHATVQSHLRAFDGKEWKDTNPPDFRYIGSGHLAGEIGKASGRLEVRHFQDGFVCEYGRASLQEDFATLAAELFMGSAVFWRGTERFDRLRVKRDLVIKVYQAADERMTLKHFQALKWLRQSAPSVASVCQERTACHPRDPVRSYDSRHTIWRPHHVRHDDDDHAQAR